MFPSKLTSRREAGIIYEIKVYIKYCLLIAIPIDISYRISEPNFIPTNPPLSRHHDTQPF